MRKLLLLLILATVACAQTTITGTIKDATGTNFAGTLSISASTITATGVVVGPTLFTLTVTNGALYRSGAAYTLALYEGTYAVTYTSSTGKKSNRTWTVPDAASAAITDIETNTSVAPSIAFQYSLVKGFTLGDVPYGLTTGYMSKLAGNTTATRKYFCQTGTGAVSAAPSWCTLQAADVPTLNQNTTGTAANLSGTPALPSGTTATTQSQGDASTKLATTAYVDTGLGTKAASNAATTVNGQSCALGSSCTVTADPTSARYKTFSCQPGLGDGLNAIPAGTYLQSSCYNDTGATVTLTGIKCWSDNAGTSTLNVTDGADTALLTGAITCSTAWAAGTQSATVTIAASGWLKFTFVADGTTKQSTWVVTETK